MYTPLDVHNARLYATQHLLKLKYDQFRNSHPHIFLQQHVQEVQRPATHDDYYVPPAIASSCFFYSLKFTEEGCRKISCFPFKERGKECLPTDDTLFVRHGKTFTMACQPACKHLYKEPTMMDTRFDGSTCLTENYLLKLYALDPHGRDNRYTIQVGANGLLELTDEYCNAHGLVLDKNGDCATTTAQAVGEIFVGSTVYRSLNLLTNPPAPAVVAPPPVPAYMTEAGWFGGGKIKRATAIPNSFLSQRDEEGFDYKLLREIAAEISIDIGVSYSASRVAHYLTKTIPESKGLHAATLAVFVKYRSPPSALSILKSAGRAISTLSVVLDAVSVGTLFVDLFDPAGFDKVLTKERVDELNARYSKMLKPVEVTPDMLFPLLEKEAFEDKKTVNFINDKVLEYLSALDVNSAGQRLDIQQKQLAATLKKVYDGQSHFASRIVFFVLTTLFLAASFTFLLPFVVVAYMYFVLFWQISKLPI